MPVPQVDFMFTHYLDPKKGFTANMNALDHQAKISAAVEFILNWGRVVHLDQNGEFRPGCHNTGVAHFLWQGPRQTTVNLPNQSNPNLFMHQAVSPTGVCGSLVATGAYELASSEYDKTQNYVPGELLTAADDLDDEDVGGVLTNVGTGAGDRVEQFVDPVCGVVSDGVETNWLGIEMLSFYSVWLPGAFA